MTGSSPISAKGTTEYPLKAMPADKFDGMVARLIRLESPAAIKPAETGDGGADMALPRAGGGYERCWQSKHFPGAINWTECDKSLAAARANWGPARYTFCFPRDLNAREQRTFDRHFRGPDMDIDVDQWNGTELQARLAGSDAGRRVARTFCDDIEVDREKTYQAIEAGGRLDTTGDALDRFSNIGRYLAGKDPFFRYPSAIHEPDGTGPGVTPGPS